ncbi:hypothetical protein ES703_103194 [subsurface metagenome]
MRNRSEILRNATRYTDSKTLVPEDTDKLRLLTLEVLVDIRDVLDDLNQSIGSNLFDHAKES